MNSSMLPSMKREEATPAVILTDCDSGGTVSRELIGDPGSNTYNLNVNVNLNAASAVGSLLAAESGGTTPRTPEILNSLIAMTNPLDQYAFSGSEKCATAGYRSGSCNDSNSSMSTGSPATSPASGTPPSIQKTCSELIKAGLKLTIESKRKMSVSECSDGGIGCVKRLKKEEVPSDEDYDSGQTGVSKSEGLTPEDEERRRRRRERNKIAATKCRLKKRERTVNLVTESEVLETQNHDLKSQLQELEVQRRQLLDMLSLHTASCLRHTATSPAAAYNSARPYESPVAGYPAYDTSSPYIRPESANVLASSYTLIPPQDVDPTMDAPYLQHQLLEEYHRPDSVLSIPQASDVTYNSEGFLPKVSNLLVIEQPDGSTEYYDECYSQGQQCHNYQDGQKMNQGLNNGCMA